MLVDMVWTLDLLLKLFRVSQLNHLSYASGTLFFKKVKAVTGNESKENHLFNYKKGRRNVSRSWKMQEIWLLAVYYISVDFVGSNRNQTDSFSCLSRLMQPLSHSNWSNLQNIPMFRRIKASFQWYLPFLHHTLSCMEFLRIFIFSFIKVFLHWNIPLCALITENFICYLIMLSSKLL